MMLGSSLLLLAYLDWCGDEAVVPSSVRPIQEEKDPPLYMGKSVGFWMEQLGTSKVSHERETAILALEKISQEQAQPAVTAITQALSDENNSVRKCAINVLSRIGPSAESARPRLLELTEDPDKEIRTIARQALDSVDPVGAEEREVQDAISVGSDILKAQATMKSKGFKCSIEAPDWLYCDRMPQGNFFSNPVVRRTQVSLYHKAGKVTSIHVTSGLIGP
jgi:hypothetical protein